MNPLNNSTGSENTSEKLSKEDVLRRLFAPATNLPESRSDKAIETVSTMNHRAVTHKQLETMIAGASEQLTKHGVKAGDKVVFYGENSPELTASILAGWTLSAMVVLVDFRAPRADVLAICKKLGAKHLVTSKNLYKSFAPETLRFSDEGIEVLEVSSIADAKGTTSETNFDINTLDLEAPAFTILTSGTTGAPKVSVHTLGSLVMNIRDLAEASGLQAGMTAVTPLPISHIFGLTVLLVTQVLGMKTVLTSLEPVPFVKAIHKHKPELIAALPQFYGALLAAPKGYINLSNSKLLLCGGAPLTVSLADKFEKTFGRQLNNGYGSTESKIVALNQDGPVLCVGKPVGAVSIDIVNEQGEVLPEGELGEVRITSNMLMDGYLNNDEETTKVLRGGQYYTGDLGRIEGGNLFVVGRKSDRIIVEGSVVHAGEIEELLRENPAVREVAVTGEPDEERGEIVKAVVVIMDDEVAQKLKSKDENQVRAAKQQLEDEFNGYCKEHLSRYQCPTKWEFLGPHDSLPKTLAGKINKKKLSEAS